jgi:hypothetical protein
MYFYSLMSIKNYSDLTKGIALVCITVAIVLGIKYFDSQRQNYKLNNQLQLDKKTYSTEIKEILNRYDSEMNQNKELLVNNSVSLQKSEENQKMTTLQLSSKFDALFKKEKQKSAKKIDSLRNLLQNTNEENRNLQSQISYLRNKTGDYTTRKIAKTEPSNIKYNRNLSARNFQVSTVRIESHRIITTNSLSETEQIKVNYTLQENKIISKGIKEIFVQIINPKNQIVGKSQSTIQFDTKTLHYSKKANIVYDQKQLDIAVLVDSDKNDLVKGTYTINLYSGPNLIGSTVVTL